MAQGYLVMVYVLGAFIIGLASHYIFKLPADNEIEQFSEKIIKEQTGLDIDLTPGDADGNPK